MMQVTGTWLKPRDEQIVLARKLGIPSELLEGQDERQVSQTIENKVYDGMVEEAASLTGVDPKSIRQNFPGIENISSLLKDRTKFRDPDIARELFIARQWKQQADSGLAYSFTPSDVYSLRGSGSVPLDGYSYGNVAAEIFRHKMRTKPYVLALGAVSGHEAGNMVEGGLEAVYCGGYYTAADKNAERKPCPDLLINSAISVPDNVLEIRNYFRQFDRNDHIEQLHKIDWRVPIVADADTGFGDEEHVGFHVDRLAAAGAAGIHLEDLRKKVCGHLAVGQKVLELPSVFIDKLGAAKEMIAVIGTKIVLIARTDAEGAGYVTYDTDPRDKSFLISGSARPRHRKGYYPIQGGVDLAIERALAYAPFVDIIWFESTYPDLEQAIKFAKAIHEKFPGKLLAYNLSPSFHWNSYFTKKVLAEMNMTEEDYAKANEITRNLVKATVKYRVYNFVSELGKAGYKFQFGTYEALRHRNFNIFKLARSMSQDGMAAWIDHERAEEEAIRTEGYRWDKTNARTGAKYWDHFVETALGGDTSGSCMTTSCETTQFVSK